MVNDLRLDIPSAPTEYADLIREENMDQICEMKELLILV